MKTVSNEVAQKMERRAMITSMVGNLFMGLAGVYAGYLSKSQAILLDGLFSLIGFSAAYLGMRVARNAYRLPNKVRPFGYAADEALFVTFRSLTLLGLVLFAVAMAALNIIGYLKGGTPEALNFSPMITYFVVIGLTCAILWGFHHWSWVRTGKQSDVLKLESQAAAFDGLVTAAAAIGLLGIHLFRDGFLAPVAPIGDSIVVLVLCATVLIQYFKSFLSGLGELAGLTAQPQYLAATRRAIRQSVLQDGGEIVDLSVSKLGRSFTVVVYYNPRRSVSAGEVDQLTLQIEKDVLRAVPQAWVAVVISEHGRVLEAGTQSTA